ncbi:hypothetical protein XENORESO_000460 [Xenotaenia resolanae]|uniref:Uncharacterized protein n=1 Tax=Xenotaenia resolanae TaxID=208358 RepID=A0ABV0WT31_9TELE
MQITSAAAVVWQHWVISGISRSVTEVQPLYEGEAELYELIPLGCKESILFSKSQMLKDNLKFIISLSIYRSTANKNSFFPHISLLLLQSYSSKNERIHSY